MQERMVVVQQHSIMHMNVLQAFHAWRRWVLVNHVG